VEPPTSYGVLAILEAPDSSPHRALYGIDARGLEEVLAKEHHDLSRLLASTGMLWPSAATGRIDGSSAMISFAAARAFDGSPPSRCASCTQHAVVGRPTIIQGRT
jgi:hypothetical protein